VNLEFVCSSGCGVCKVRLADFEVYRSEAMAGDLIESRTVPRIVSVCCGSSVDVWDERVQDVTGQICVEPSEVRLVAGALIDTSPELPGERAYYAKLNSGDDQTHE